MSLHWLNKRKKTKVTADRRNLSDEALTKLEDDRGRQCIWIEILKKGS